MFKSKYGKVLTIILIIAIILIIGLVGFWIFEKVNADQLKKEHETVIEEFERDHGISSATPKPTDENKDDEQDEPTPDVEETPVVLETPDASLNPTPNSGSNSNSGSTSTTSRKTYKGFIMVGYIQIPRTNVNVPILEKVTKKSLEVAVGILYPKEAPLNEPGNVVIAGHNYRNQQFFSNNRKLQIGDKIYIGDEQGRKMTYEVYENFEASPEDTSFYTRDTGGVPEITLTTCTEDSSKRTIIFARAK